MKRKYDWPNYIFNFLAVILGVYLAFYMNERAKAKQDKKESVLLMNALSDELSHDIKIYETYEIPTNIRHLKNVEKLFDLLQNDSSDRIGDHLAVLFELENFAPSSSVYNSMKASGRLILIDDLVLQKKLAAYYEGPVAESEMKGAYQVSYFTDELLTWMTANADLAEMKLTNKNELHVLKNKLIIYNSLIGQKIAAYENIVENSKQLKMHIDSVLRPESARPSAGTQRMPS